MPKQSIGDINKYAEFYHREIEPKMYKFLVGFPVLAAAITLAEYFSLKFILSDDLRSSSVETFYIVGVALIFAAAIWYFVFYRQRTFQPDEVGILIALTKMDQKVDEELTKLNKKLEHLISTENFKARIVVRLVADYLIPKNEMDAYKLRARFRARLIVWGNVDHGNHDSEPHTVFVPVYFSYQLHLPPDRAAIIQKGFGHVLANRRWIVSEKNNIIDREFLAQNLEEVSLYMIGTVLFFAQKQQESFDVLGRVLKKYESKQVLMPDDRIALVNIKILLHEIYKTEVRKLEFGPRAKRREDDIPRAEVLISQMKVTGHDAFALLLRSQIEFARGQIKKAIASAKEAYALTPNDSSACFSVAFLLFYNEDLVGGWFWLKQANKMGDKSKVLEQIPTIATWYEDALELDPRRGYLHFPLGVIYYEYIRETKNAEQSLGIFLKNYRGVDDKELRPLIVESERILKKIRKGR